MGFYQLRLLTELRSAANTTRLAYYSPLGLNGKQPSRCTPKKPRRAGIHQQTFHHTRILHMGSESSQELLVIGRNRESGRLTSSVSITELVSAIQDYLPIDKVYSYSVSSSGEITLTEAGTLAVTLVPPPASPAHPPELENYEAPEPTMDSLPVDPIVEITKPEHTKIPTPPSKANGKSRFPDYLWRKN